MGAGSSDRLDSKEPAATGVVVVSSYDGPNYMVVVPGDALGTGNLGILQLIRMVNALVGSKPFEGAYLEAADMNEIGKLDLVVFVTLVRLLTRQDRSLHLRTEQIDTFTREIGLPLVTEAVHQAIEARWQLGPGTIHIDLSAPRLWDEYFYALLSEPETAEAIFVGGEIERDVTYPYTDVYPEDG